MIKHQNKMYSRFISSSFAFAAVWSLYSRDSAVWWRVTCDICLFVSCVSACMIILSFIYSMFPPVSGLTGVLTLRQLRAARCSHRLSLLVTAWFKRLCSRAPSHKFLRERTVLLIHVPTHIFPRNCTDLRVKFESATFLVTSLPFSRLGCCHSQFSTSRDGK